MRFSKRLTAQDLIRMLHPTLIKEVIKLFLSTTTLLYILLWNFQFTFFLILRFRLNTIWLSFIYIYIYIGRGNKIWNNFQNFFLVCLIQFFFMIISIIQARNDKESIIWFTPKSSQNFLIYRIQSKENNLPKQSFF